MRLKIIVKEKGTKSQHCSGLIDDKILLISNMTLTADIQFKPQNKKIHKGQKGV